MIFADTWKEAAGYRWERVLQLHNELVNGVKEPNLVLEEAKSLKEVHMCRVKPNATWARRFMRRFGIDTWSCNTAGTYLDYGHPHMVTYRNA